MTPSNRNNEEWLMLMETKLYEESDWAKEIIDKMSDEGKLRAHDIFRIIWLLNEAYRLFSKERE